MGGFNSILQALTQGTGGPPPTTPPFLPQGQAQAAGNSGSPVGLQTSPMPQAPPPTQAPNPNAQFETPEAQSAIEELSRIAKGEMLKKERPVKQSSSVDDLIGQFKSLQGAVQDPTELRQKFIKQYYNLDPNQAPTGKQKFAMFLQQLAEGGANAHNKDWQPLNERATDWAQRSYGEQTNRLGGMEGLLRAQQNLEWQRQKQSNDLDEKREVEARKAAQNIASDAIKRGQFLQQAHFQNGKLDVAQYTNELKKHAQEYQEKYGVGIPPQVMELEIAQLRQTHPEAYLQLLQYKDFLAFVSNRYKAALGSTSQTTIDPITQIATTQRQKTYNPGVIPPPNGFPGSLSNPTSPVKSKEALSTTPASQVTTPPTGGMAKLAYDAGSHVPRALGNKDQVTRFQTNAQGYDTTNTAIATLANEISSGRAAKEFGPTYGNNVMKWARTKFSDLPEAQAAMDFLTPTLGMAHAAAIRPSNMRITNSLMEQFKDVFGKQSDNPEGILKRVLFNRLLLQSRFAVDAGDNQPWSAKEAEIARQQIDKYVADVKAGKNNIAPDGVSLKYIRAQASSPPPANSSTTRGKASAKTWAELKGKL